MLLPAVLASVVMYAYYNVSAWAYEPPPHGFPFRMAYRGDTGSRDWSIPAVGANFLFWLVVFYVTIIPLAVWIGRRRGAERRPGR